MMPVATIQVPVYLARPEPGDRVLGRAEAKVASAAAEVTLTVRGLYLAVEDGPSWAIDLNGLAKAMADAVNPPAKLEATR